MQFSVKTLAGMVLFQGSLESDTRIWDLKRRIARRWSLAIETQRLVFRGRELIDGRTLGDYNVYDGAIINFMSGLKGG